jgi:hypothetical protein
MQDWRPIDAPAKDCQLRAMTRPRVTAAVLLGAFVSGAVAQTNPVERDVKLLPGAMRGSASHQYPA